MRFHFCKYFAHFFSQILLPQAFSCAKAGIEGVLLRKTSPGPAAGRHKILLPCSSFDRTLCRFVGIQALVLLFVKIHPWNDGNGRSARLCEKWFLAQKLGKKAWFVESEKMYYRHHPSYYQAIRLLDPEYPILQFERALPFLLMLPGAV